MTWSMQNCQVQQAAQHKFESGCEQMRNYSDSITSYGQLGSYCLQWCKRKGLKIPTFATRYLLMTKQIGSLEEQQIFTNGDQRQHYVTLHTDWIVGLFFHAQNMKVCSLFHRLACMSTPYMLWIKDLNWTLWLTIVNNLLGDILESALLV